jgi:hypothetical protein
MDTTEALRIARQMRFEGLSEHQLRELANAIKAAEALAARLPRDLEPAEECAHVFRPSSDRKARP